MPVLHLTHNNSQLFIPVAILPPLYEDISDDDLRGQRVQQQPKSYNALVDTGATASCITSEVAEKVGLKSKGKVHVQGVSGLEDHESYLFRIAFIQQIRDDMAGIHELNKNIEGSNVHSGGQFDVLARHGRSVNGNADCSWE